MYPKVATPYDQNPARISIVANAGKRANPRRGITMAAIFGIQAIIGLILRAPTNA
jgi:murein tripeptide amidase MpaA